MSKLIDMTDIRFGRLTVLHRMKNNKHNRAVWKCACDCGGEVITDGNILRTGMTKSCGCLRSEMGERLGKSSATHGMTHSAEFNIWAGMKKRCNDKNNQGYRNYGARGIKVCDRWIESFDNFYADMGKRPDGLSVDRIDNDGDYTPENCRWATDQDQCRNYRRNVLNEVAVRVARYFYRKGISVAEIAKTYNVNRRTLNDAIRGITWEGV